MIPKVIVWNESERDKLLAKLNLVENELLALDAEKVGVEDVRHFINESLNTALSRPNYKMIIWMADNLSWECQAVLLKPLEELGSELSFYLVVKNENGLMPTIISRCMVEQHSLLDEHINNGYWDRVMKCWNSGPGACITYADEFDKESAEKMTEELLMKLKNNLVTGVSEKRLQIIEEVLKLTEDLKMKNLNIKLAVGDFLLRSQRLIKT